MVGGRAPLLVDVLVTASARGARHEKIGRDDPAMRRCRRRRKERATRSPSLFVHSEGHLCRVFDPIALLLPAAVLQPACDTEREEPAHKSQVEKRKPSRAEV